MSALSETSGGFVAEYEVMPDEVFGNRHEAAIYESADLDEPAGGVRGWMYAKTVGEKLDAIAFINIVAVAIILLSILFGGWYALEMRQQRVEISEAAYDSAQMVADIGDARLFVQHYAVTGNREDLAAAQDSLRQADRTLRQLESHATEIAPTTVPAIDELNASLAALASRVSAASDSRGTREQWQAFADSVYVEGDDIIATARDLRDELVAVGEAEDENAQTDILMLFAMFLVMCVGVAVLVLLSNRYIGGDLSRTLGRISDVATRLAAGEKGMHIPGTARPDEIGDLARSFEVFAQSAEEFEKISDERAKLRAERGKEMQRVADRFETTVGKVVGGVASASSQLQRTAGSMSEAADRTSQEAGEAARHIAEASTGATAAAAASDEFAMSIGEISRQASHSAELARQANDTAKGADETISALSTSANEVGAIVELIQSIAKRTNLLALNASIEAARGGEAGRGFAVVASEVKELAAQTSRATEDVAAQIRAMQDSTGASVSALRAVARQISEIETTATSIASAVDQQSVAGRDLARSIDVAARASDDVSRHVSQVRETSLETGAAASQVLSSANDLEQQADELRQQVATFLGQVRQG